MGIFIAAFTLLMILRDAVFDPKYRDVFLLKYIPELGARTWLIIGLAALIILILEGGYSKASSDRNAFRQLHKRRVRELKEGHRAELISARTEELIKVQRAALEDRERQVELVRAEAQQFSLQTNEQTHELKRLEPNLVATPHFVAAHRDKHDVIVEGAIDEDRPSNALSEMKRNVLAAIVIFNNKLHPERKVGEVSEVSAEITYSFFDGRYPFEINRGAWLSEKDNKVVFGVKDEHKLIIATVEGTKEPYVFAISREFAGSHLGMVNRSINLNADLYGVRVRLVAESESRVISDSEFILEIVRHPNILPRLERAKHWKVNRLLDFGNEGLEFIKRNQDGDTSKQLEEEVDAWETKAADFIKQHLSESHKSKFLVGSKGSGRYALPSQTSFTLYERIDARISRLLDFAKELSR